MNINKELKKLQLVSGTYIVVGSGILGALGIRATEDIDLVVDLDTYERLKNSDGWKEELFAGTDYVIKNGLFDVGTSWDSADDQPNLTNLLATSTEIDGITYLNLERLLKWKQKRGREKDKLDVELIQGYLQNQKRSA